MKTPANFLRFYLIVMFAWTLDDSSFLWNHSFQTDQLLWPGLILNLGYFGPWAMKLVFFLSLITAGLFIWKPKNRLYQTLWGLSYLLWVSMIHSRGHIYQSFHSTTIFFLALPFLNLSNNRPLEFRSFVPLQALMLIPYAMSGFWKVHDLIFDWIAHNPGHYQLDGFAKVLALRAHITGFESELLNLHVAQPLIAQVAYWLILLLQSSCLVLIFFPRSYILLGFFLTLFHAMTPLLFDFHYWPMACATFIVLVMLSYFYKEEHKRQQVFL